MVHVGSHYDRRYPDRSASLNNHIRVPSTTNLAHKFANTANLLENRRPGARTVPVEATSGA
jgi:hypothetical protein